MIKKDRRIVLRADGNNSIGLGHIMRLLGLFGYLENYFNCVFIIKQPDIKVKQLIELYCETITLETQNINDEINKLDSCLNPTDILVLDGYNFNETYQKHFKSKVYKLVMIDDKADTYFYADLVINHGGDLLRDRYNKEPYTKLLSGIDYLILRKEFLEASFKERKINKIDSVFICMGGSDPFNITIKALKASIKCNYIKKIIVITGNAFKNQVELENIIVEGVKNKAIIYEKDIDSKRIVELISLCELAICPASSVALEACCVKVGLLTGMVVDNQNSIHYNLIKSKCCISVGDFNKATTEDIYLQLFRLNNIELIKDIIKNQSIFIDGNSDKRILNEFELLCK